MAPRTRVLITGASSGFGALTVRALVQAGFDVVAGIRESAGRNAGAVAELRAAAQGPGALEVVELDVTSDDSVNAAIAAAGEVDVLINNAGVAAAGLIETFTIAQAEQVFAVNFFGALRMMRAVLPQMKRRGRGLMLHVTSELGRIVMPGLGIYTASKFALEGLSESMHYELSACGVRSVVVEPGSYPTTGILRNMVWPAEPGRAEGYGPVAEMPQQLGAALQGMVEQGLAPDPGEVAKVIVGLVQAESCALRTVMPGSPDLETLSELNRAALAAQVAYLQRLGLGFLIRNG